MKNRKQPESIMPEPSPGIAARETDEQVLLRLEWTVLRRLDGLLQGDYRTLLRGFGLDFAGLREYQFEGRRSPHRLECHRADELALRAPVQRGPRHECVVPR